MPIRLYSNPISQYDDNEEPAVSIYTSILPNQLDWASAMRMIEQLADDRGLEFYQLRNFASQRHVAELKDSGMTIEEIGSSDSNFFAHSRFLTGNIEQDADDLEARERLIDQVAAGRPRRQVLAELREFFAPVV